MGLIVIIGLALIALVGAKIPANFTTQGLTEVLQVLRKKLSDIVQKTEIRKDKLKTTLINLLHDISNDHTAIVDTGKTDLHPKVKRSSTYYKSKSNSSKTWANGQF